MTIKIVDNIAIVGSDFFFQHGKDAIRDVFGDDVSVCLDLKLHDIPVTVAKTIKALLPLNPDFITVHISAGKEMMECAVKTIEEYGSKTRLLGVMVLPHLSTSELISIGVLTNKHVQLECLALLAKSCGLSGVICSEYEASFLKDSLKDIQKDGFMVWGSNVWGQSWEQSYDDK